MNCKFGKVKGKTTCESVLKWHIRTWAVSMEKETLNSARYFSGEDSDVKDPVEEYEKGERLDLNDNDPQESEPDALCTNAERSLSDIALEELNRLKEIIDDSKVSFHAYPFWHLELDIEMVETFRLHGSLKVDVESTIV